MKSFCRIVCIFIVACLFVCCNKQEEGLTTTGYLELGVSENIEVITRSANVANHSLAVDICDAVKDTVVKHFTNYNDIAGERILLNVGSYKVKVTSNPTKKMEFERPSFYGESEKVMVKAGETTKAAVECFLSCVKVTTEFTKPVRDKFASCVAKISDDTQSYLEYSMTESRAGYYKPGFLLVNLTLTNKEGLTFNMSKLIEDTEARDHYHLIFDLIASGDDNSGMDFDISIETDPTNDENHTVTIPLPGTGYEQQPPVVRISGTNNGGILGMKESERENEKYNVTIHAQSENIGISKVQLLITSDSKNFEEFPTIVELSGLDKDNKEFKFFEELGFELPLNYSNAKAEFSYKFTAAHLNAGNYTFKLLVSDKNGRETTCSFTYKVVSEIMTIPINDEWKYVWSRFAYLQGYAEAPDKGASFKYRKVGDEDWIDVTNEVQFNENYASVRIAELRPKTNYEYKFVQGEAEGETKTFTTDEEREVPNLNLDTWSDNYTPGGWWTSGNEGTKTLSLYPTLKDVGSKNSGVKMYTSYFSGKVVIVQVDKLVAGNLFLGKYQGLSGMEGVKLDFGKEYQCRPSKLNFQYKYASAPINVVNNKRGEATEDNDEGFIYFLLTDKIYNIDTTKEDTFIKEDSYATDDHILAYGSYAINQTISDFTQGTIELTYKNLDKKPSYIIIVASSSKKGDYFTGGEGSTLWLDELELEYPSDYPNTNK